MKPEQLMTSNCRLHVQGSVNKIFTKTEAVTPISSFLVYHLSATTNECRSSNVEKYNLRIRVLWWLHFLKLTLRVLISTIS
jgi:hypothetical protein